MNQLTAFLTAIVALSLAAERTVEVLKGFFPTIWIFKPQTNPAAESRRAALMHVLAGVLGGAAAISSHVDILSYLNNSYIGHFPAPTLHTCASFAMSALLTSFGSAFWNHVIDILQATKTTAELNVPTPQPAIQAPTQP